MKSSDNEYDTLEYYRARVSELEKERNVEIERSSYYQTELAKSHELLGRILHQTSERWDTVRLIKYYPTDNLHNKRTIKNPSGKQND
jgi:hypothetical protein